MATRDRPAWAVQAAELFLRQDYPHLELLVVEDGSPRLAGLLPRDPRIRLVSTGRQSTIGALRNQACTLARGEVVVLWDDDDWYGPDRVTRQVEPILRGDTDLTALSDGLWLEVDSWRSWRVAPHAQRRLLMQGMYCGTAAFRAGVFGGRVRFADVSHAEDVQFLHAAVAAGARLAPVDGHDCFVYVRHGRNTWRVVCGQYGGRSSWQAVDVPPLPAADLAFLRAQGRQRRAGLVSCLMPTADRRPFVRQALTYFARQTLTDRELVVLDDGADPVGDLCEGVPGVRYHRLERRLVLGAKRNLAVELAEGDLLAHWDDDDWYSPDRLALQAGRMATAGAELSGVSTLAFYSPAARKAWTYRWPGHRRPWVAGTSLMFTRDLWQRHAFPETAVGEDTRFVWRAPAQRVLPLDEPCVVGLVHPGNTVRKAGRGGYWAPRSPESVEELLGDDLGFYRPGPRG